jgi:polyisoprenoid-binding protein YceI
VRLRGVSKPVTLTFTWTPGAQPVLSGKATVKRLDFGVGGGDDWADTKTIPNEVAVSTKVVFKPAK